MTFNDPNLLSTRKLAVYNDLDNSTSPVKLEIKKEDNEKFDRSKLMELAAAGDIDKVKEYLDKCGMTYIVDNKSDPNKTIIMVDEIEVYIHKSSSNGSNNVDSTKNNSAVSSADEALKKAMKEMGLRKTSAQNIYCENHNPNKPAGDYTEQRHYYWDETNQKMVELPNVYHVSRDGHEVKDMIDNYNKSGSVDDLDKLYKEFRINQIIPHKPELREYVSNIMANDNDVDPSGINQYIYFKERELDTFVDSIISQVVKNSGSQDVETLLSEIKDAISRALKSDPYAPENINKSLLATDDYLLSDEEKKLKADLVDVEFDSDPTKIDGSGFDYSVMSNTEAKVADLTSDWDLLDINSALNCKSPYTGAYSKNSSTITLYKNLEQLKPQLKAYIKEQLNAQGLEYNEQTVEKYLNYYITETVREAIQAKYHDILPDLYPDTVLPANATLQDLGKYLVTKVKDEIAEGSTSFGTTWNASGFDPLLNSTSDYFLTPKEIKQKEQMNNKKSGSTFATLPPSGSTTEDAKVDSTKKDEETKPANTSTTTVNNKEVYNFTSIKVNYVSNHLPDSVRDTKSFNPVELNKTNSSATKIFASLLDDIKNAISDVKGTDYLKNSIGDEALEQLFKVAWTQVTESMNSTNANTKDFVQKVLSGLSTILNGLAENPENLAYYTDTTVDTKDLTNYKDNVVIDCRNPRKYDTGEYHLDNDASDKQFQNTMQQLLERIYSKYPNVDKSTLKIIFHQAQQEALSAINGNGINPVANTKKL